MLGILAVIPVLPVLPAVVVLAWLPMLVYLRRLRWWFLAAAGGLSGLSFPIGFLAGRIEGGGGSSRRLIWWNGTAALWCCFGMLVITALAEGIYLLVSRPEVEPESVNADTDEPAAEPIVDVQV